MPDDQRIETSATSGYFGKYRAKVVSTKDTTFSGRIQVTADVLMGEEPWADPCVPYAGKDQGLFMMPPDQTDVWIEFEGGNLKKPIWSGFAWAEGGAPTKDNKEMLIKTPSGTIKFHADSKNTVSITTEKHTVELSDGAVTIKTSGGATVELNGKTTKINDGGLEVT
ncbi:phage baseplate assembly protein V [Pacificoceanicola onchidii]|uniref:phage baseplate assembly protein V n=1 Tax=Pacificoceanicola onchidii TaxID=2562685 RepID=UPI0010A556D0|nr:phage baseplate assembly protein V [Pacificoceanicola onchidii]